MSAAYTKVRFQDTNGPRTVILRDARVTSDPARVIGTEVNKNGEEVAPAGFDNRTHIIDHALVLWTRPMTWNLHYAQLEETR